MSRQSYHPHGQDGLGARPSVFLASDARPSYASTGSSVNSMGAGPSSAAAMRLQAKRQELEGLTMLRDQSARLVRDVEALGDNIDALVEGGEAVAAVMSSWNGVFRAIQIARQSMASRDPSGSEAIDEAGGRRVPDTLVRLPIDAGTTSTAPGDPAEQPDAANVVP